MGRDATKACSSTFASVDLAKVRKRGWGRRVWTWSQYGQVSARAEIEAGHSFVGFHYTYSAYGERRVNDCNVPIVTTPAHFGGEREWLCCPRCGGRCRVVYLAMSGPRCRKCLRLSYPSQRVDARQRAFAQQSRIVRKLGGDDGDNFPDRPKGMHWNTYQRWFDKFEEAERRQNALLADFIAGWAPRYGQLFGDLNG